MKLIAVSGGPDSMLLLDVFKHHDIVVAHVNYNKRNSSKRDQKIVEDYCFKNNIKLEILNLTDYEVKGNFHDWARKKRFDFFKLVYEKYNCDEILLAHHKDDFVETFLIQKNQKRKPLYWSIKSKNFNFGMNINRPFIHKYWKNQILKILDNKQIFFGQDETNKENIYLRNKIRNNLLNKEFLKRLIYIKILFLNFFKLRKIKKIEQDFNKWKEQNFDKQNFLKSKFQENLITIFISEKTNNSINLSRGKIQQIIKFINSEKNEKKFILNKEFYLVKAKKIIKVLKK
ncbi:conserved hypothetical protein [Mycoplasmopsis pulmonis]|uniref:tRNA(Ile)-lysidine synthase n=1 Tax=Mycoplasmopsis pulmonis (strain UAB CTIP) TaxID=272635 RepID=TILS_MYCPU|nr:tRNA lysidine(34) synthetase TilS [Mycoplasmopsis pulmonis]Q98PE3.1 RecName: Full=tRNA(Ile)-lysidine synthase; AltName: Full=tRNA(Ile)-2-lysyl-cytidine synthase; AltName: Full=tRNA(Ile)-lysidine synthetase [Mycoplasmopsis pulmonis UAB CTIP]MDZ7293378.1 tRNA lysidine(34) synthetase TilS [Mycoplasmopsis pulmonis]CAC13953.1 conserved hypothetical protein [Mycoplasmopsis pulmonis]VEU68541.1 tRNA(Ile)-lysidine synthase [Mycoplasmopsis pulmonis]